MDMDKRVGEKSDAGPGLFSRGLQARVSLLWSRFDQGPHISLPSYFVQTGIKGMVVCSVLWFFCSLPHPLGLRARGGGRGSGSSPDRILGERHGPDRPIFSWSVDLIIISCGYGGACVGVCVQG